MKAEDRRIRASYELFARLDCCSGEYDEDFDYDTALALMVEDRMRFHILNCLAALLIVQIQKNKDRSVDAHKCEVVKRKVFVRAISMMINAEFDSPIVSAFPDDDDDLSNKRSWLPMHFAIAFTVENIISEEDIHVLHDANPLAMHSLSEIDEEGDPTGYTPIDLLCMQKKPNMSVVRKICLLDPQAFVSSDHSGKSALHIIAQHSESMEMLQSILQMDHSLTKKKVIGPMAGKATPLGLLSGRSVFPSFDDMIKCLIDTDSTIEVIYDGVRNCMLQYKKSPFQGISPGSRGHRSLILLGKLLDANANVANHSGIFRMVCGGSFRGELGIAVLTLFHSKNSEGIRAYHKGRLPVHIAASHSSLDMLKFLVRAYPESLTMVVGRQKIKYEGCTLLHLPLLDSDSYVAEATAKIEYILHLCPALIHVKDIRGHTPLHCSLVFGGKLKIECIKAFCSTDESVVRDKCTPTNTDLFYSQQLPLHLFIECQSPMMEVSDEGDCFRLLLRLYPAAAGIKDGRLASPYDLAVQNNLSVYFLRLLLNTDPTIDPVARSNLNYVARREGMFLAFSALSTTLEPTVWVKLRDEYKDLLRHVISYL
jgi:ankyrin repeat protein